MSKVKKEEIKEQLQEKLDSNELSTEFSLTVEKFSGLAKENPLKVLGAILLLAGLGVCITTVLSIALVMSTVTFPFRMIGKLYKWIKKQYGKRGIEELVERDLRSVD